MTSTLSDFEIYLTLCESAPATKEKYVCAVRRFLLWLAARPLDKSAVLAYKAHLSERVAPSTVNGALAALFSYFSFLGRPELRVKPLRLQRSIFISEERELSRTEYERLLAVAKEKGNERLYLLMQTVCVTGIRISELRYITVEAVRVGYADVTNKGKRRRIFLPKTLCRALSAYLGKRKRRNGAVFVTRSGTPLDRSNIWADMKRLCERARVARSKVFPHNLRHLFARTFYSTEKDIVRLSDILGHTSVNTTRIYTAESGGAHRRSLEKLARLLC